MKKSHIAVILLFVFVQLSGLVVQAIVQLTGIVASNHLLARTIVLNYAIFSYIAALIVSIIILYRSRTREDRSLLGVELPYSGGKSTLLIIGGLFLAWGVQIIFGLIEQKLFGVPNKSKNTEDFIAVIKLYPFFIILPVLLAPIYEELVFRYILFRAFLKKLHWVIASILSSVIFGLIHFDFEHLLIYTGIGLVFAWLFKKTKRIIVPIVVHSLMNTLVVLFQLNLDKLAPMMQQ